MNSHQKDILARLECLPLNSARDQIAAGAFGDIGSPNHIFCLSSFREKRERTGLAIAIAALVVSLISILISLYI